MPTKGLVLRSLAICVVTVMLGGGACAETEQKEKSPGLAERGTTMTTVKPTRQDLTNRVSLAGKVTLDPVFGLVAPVAGQVRYLNVSEPKTTPTKPTRVATVWANNKAHHVEVPAGAVFSGRLVDDKSTVAAGTPIASAKHVGYGIVAEIDGAQAYRIADAISMVQGQIDNGPGPFTCTVLGTVAALPAGTIPEPTTAATSPAPGATGAPVQNKTDNQDTPQGSDPTGLRLVCTAPADVKMINGASAKLEVTTAKVTNVLVLPVEAVAGSQGKGKVDVVKADGTHEIKDVVLGLSDGKVIEIKSGLTGDETIAVPGPDLPQPAPTDGGAPGVGRNK